MLTAIENLKETMKKDGHPDRFVKQYEFMHLLLPDTYYMGDYPLPPNPGEGYDRYGVFWKLPQVQGTGLYPLPDSRHERERVPGRLRQGQRRDRQNEQGDVLTKSSKKL